MVHTKPKAPAQKTKKVPSAVNLHSDHWYLLIIYPALKRIDCLNWFETHPATVKLICRLMHVYLWAHTYLDNNFFFTANEWKFCVVRRGRVPTQLNGFDCGPISIRVIEYLIAGVPLTFTQETMGRYRFKILFALRLQTFPWLVSPAQPLTIPESITKLNVHVQTTNAEEEDDFTRTLREEARAARLALTEIFKHEDRSHALEEEWSQGY